MTWSVIVDAGMCQGHACCMMAAPAVFDIDDNSGKAIVLQANPDDSLRDAVDKAARSCPARAIVIVDA